MPRNPIADHTTFTHELTEAEASAGLLSIDDDLACWPWPLTPS